MGLPFTCTIIFIFGFIWLTTEGSAEKSQPPYLNLQQLFGIDTLILEPPVIKNIRDHVQFLLHTRKTRIEGVSFPLSPHSLKTSKFLIHNPVIILIHGFLGQLRDGWMTTAKDALLHEHDANVILVGWTNITQVFQYPWVVEQSYGVAERVGELIDFLVTNGAANKNMHIIGHSVGAHIAGVASKAAKLGPVGRITGLDAAYPLYLSLPNADRLDAADADYVDCIHTSSGILGVPEPFCDADFYPNGGLSNQPGCDPLNQVFCSHLRSHEYFTESIDPKHKFKALTCRQALLFLDCFDEGALMGYPDNGRFKGVFYVPTGSKSPFSVLPVQTNKKELLPSKNKRFKLRGV
ncbi:Lipase [Nesidiocoris tenuis]|uniref:Lipase n=1 Tax=Nesidiocoris tenuis TaxID=355587 RepID=A0ABN7AQC1_9HEMI|nr:Lipase [Nesidiocoris tenuis]